MPAFVIGATALLGLLVFSSSGVAWVHVEGARSVSIHATDVGGGNLVSLAGLVALVASILGAVFLWRAHDPRRVRICLGTASAMFCMALLGALIGVQDVHNLQDELDRAATLDAFGNAEPLAAEATVASGLWQALIAGGAGIAVALWGYLLVRRREMAA